MTSARPRAISASLLGAILTALLVASPGSVRSADPPAEPSSAPPTPSPPVPALLQVDGHWTVRYRTRWTGEDTDQDLDQTLRLDAVHRQAVSAAVHLRVHGDLDAHGNSVGHGVFEDIWDTDEGRVQTRFYYGYLEFRQVPGTAITRLGRQLLVATPEIFHLDGARVESRPLAGDLRLELGAYGGIPVHLYESSARGDQLYGAHAAAEPWRGGRVRLDAAHIEDERDGETEKDDLIGIALWQRFETIGVSLSHTRLDGSSRDLEARLDLLLPERDLRILAHWYDQPTTRRNATPEVDPFSSALHDLAPHQVYSATAFQGIGEHLTLSVGFAHRALEDASDESAFNHEFTRGFATVAWEDWPWDGAGGFITGDDWDTDDDESRTYSGELSQELASGWRVRVGSLFALYEYDFLLEEERDRVRTHYLRIEGSRRSTIRWRFGYEYERDPFDEYHVVDVRMSLSF